MHSRICVSAISTFRLSLIEDLAFWSEHGIDTAGVSVAKLEAFGWDGGHGARRGGGGRRVARRQPHRARSVPSRRSDAMGTPTGAPAARARRGGRDRRRVPRVHDRTVRAAHLGRRGRRAGARDGRRARRGAATQRRVRDRAHQLVARRRRVRPHAARRARPRRPARHRCVHGDQRVLGRAQPRAHDPRRHRPHPSRAGQRLLRRHDRVVAAARTRRRRHPARAHHRCSRSTRATTACSTSS